MAAPLPAIIILTLGAAALGGADALRVLLQFTGRSPCLDISITIFLMFVVTAYLLGAVLLARFVRGERTGAGYASTSATGGAQRHGTAAATDCLAQVSLLVSVCVGFLVAACLVALPRSFPMITDVYVPVGVAIATVAGTTLGVSFSRRVRNADGVAAPTPATGTWRRLFVKLMALAVVAGVLAMALALALAYAHFQSRTAATTHVLPLPE